MADKSVFDMTDQEIVATYEPLLDAILRPAFYRVLGMNSVHMNIKVFRRIVEAETRVGKYKGTIEDTVLGERQFFWNNVEVTPEVFTSYNISGPSAVGTNTVVARRGWWQLWLGRNVLANIINVRNGGMAVAPGMIK